MSKKVEFKEIWETLRGVDVSSYTETKMNLTYLSWSRAWMLTVDHFPDARYEFHDFEGVPYRALPDGSAEVITSVTIEGHTRSMILPIMDHKNLSIINAKSRQVNDNRMRCLVKNLCMFGLGMSVFAVWDDHLPDAEKDRQPEGKKAPAKKKASKKKAAKKTPKPPSEKTFEKIDKELNLICSSFEESLVSENRIGNEDEAEIVAGLLIQYVSEFTDSTEEVKASWKRFSELTSLMKADYPDQYESVRVRFGERKQELINRNNSLAEEGEASE